LMTRSLSEIAAAVGGTLSGQDARVSAVVTDSRQATPGSLFVALKGERFDGGNFVEDAFARGASGVIARAGAEAPTGPSVLVGSTAEALMRLAAHERSATGAKVVAITGANGKTTTKDLAAAIFSRTMKVHANPQSFNNEVGLPVTLLTSPPDVQVIIAEMGARHVGDVATLCAIARPDIVVVTNIGLAHVEIFGSWEAIVEAGAEPVEALERSGLAVLNVDDPVVRGYSERTRARVVSFGRSKDADVCAENVDLDADGIASFDLVSRGARARVRSPVPGEHIVSDALAAAACGLEFEVPLSDIADGLASALLSRWRMETSRTAGGVRVINDAYNANPESMAAALKTARRVAGDSRLVAVLGSMAELGDLSEREHDRIGELAARIRVDRLVVVGVEARPIALAAVREGMLHSDVNVYDDVDGAIADVRAHAEPGDVVLCKASRVCRLERVAEALT
jgi:UDP-N-acetylmuramoyl-tripeptide--D-alanyl-D-alanine ligase